MAKEPVVSGVGVLDLKLGKCLTAPTKRMAHDLHELARDCNRVRNAIVRQWLCWHWSHPDHVPQPLRDKEWLVIHQGIVGGKKVRVVSKEGHWITLRCSAVNLNVEPTPLLEDRWFPQCLVASWHADSLYNVARRTAPQLAAKIVSSLVQQVVADLSAKVPFASGELKCQQILRCEQNPITYAVEKSLTIPVPTQDSALIYEGRVSRKLSAGVDSHLKTAAGISSAAVRVPLFSRESSRKHLAMITRLEVGKLPRGIRSNLTRIATGEWKMLDSKLIFKRGAWFLQLVYHQPRRNLGLTPEHEAELVLEKLGGWHPLRIIAKEQRTQVGQSELVIDESFWRIGQARELLADYTRVVTRRKVLAHRYKSGARKGRGKKQHFATYRSYSRATRDMEDVYSWGVIAEIIKFCTRKDCGTLLYREPGKGLRTKSWFAYQGVPFDWTKFRSKLAHKCWIFGVTLKVERMSTKEHRERFGEPDLPGTARKTQAPQATGVTDATLKLGKGKRGHQAAPLATSRVRREPKRLYGDGDAMSEETNEP